MTGRLAGKVALVTGAGSVGPGWGNGRASAVRFAQEGATVFAVDLNREALEETVARFDGPEGSIIPLQCDVTDTAAVETVVSTCVEQAGRIDVLVNNVGGSRAGGPVEMTEEEWNKQLEFNLTTTFLTCKHVLPHMKEAGTGAIVNTASTSGIRWTGAAQAAYAASKAGVIAFTRSVAVQHAPLGIRANTVIPGQLHTPMVEVRLAGQRSGGDVDKLLEQRLSRIPIGFMGDGRDTANVALFLASDEARFITGTEIIVDGGMSARCD
ncbi:3-oxoacyl-ACP reductase [Rhodococcus sp. 05-340-1]|uniref:SDR family NAD(P)-dependent oxidoreductase n=1 Tax=unclassified Rhodococcus (in: high G+C Gram-positive bacteria) TaxID=192944 RepID=UPI000B9A56EC|nr:MULTISPECIES: SDR family NAD(P)-dependent oxidoreductase [unclassified Rhodococcus (in: high G+C Gram-positive bacteria)]OZD66961.1 3-oxoacyl-ACP reductase [Rhodococcus sp. 05-340-2]OZD81038.1 3-oxoacyl-ACP reductase [Rhodococcus sp. 05-340-1]